jgi:16S rRNA (uracil1498-N3)-methyltransferase
MPRFFTNVCLQVGEQLSLPIEVVRHMMVLRLRVGEEVRLFNNDGCDYLARILDLHKREARVEITGKIDVQSESNFVITLMISLIANDKFELVIQKAVELGVQKIIPIITEKTQRVKIDR